MPCGLHPVGRMFCAPAIGNLSFMVQIGYTMMTEQAGPRDLVDHVVAAERAGFDFSVTSDHYFPWLDEQGHAPYAWSVLGAAAQATSRIPLMTYVTCPTVRYHPAVVAQKAATVQLLSEGRFRLGLGSGENLNEHVVGAGWPAAHVRLEMLEEAVEIIRALFAGGDVSHHGTHYDVENARLWDLPEQLPPDRHRGLRTPVLRARRPARRPGRRHRAQEGTPGGVRPPRRQRKAPGRPGSGLLRHRPGRGAQAGARAVPLVRRRLEGQLRAAGSRRIRPGHPVRTARGRRAVHRVRLGRRDVRRGGAAVRRGGLHRGRPGPGRRRPPAALHPMGGEGTAARPARALRTGGGAGGGRCRRGRTAVSAEHPCGPA